MEVDDDDGLVAGQERKIRTYRRRFAIVCITMLFNVGGAFGRSYFGQVNDIYAEYFEVSLATADWLTLATAASGLVACVAIALIASTVKVGLRAWCLLQCGIFAISFTVLAASCLSRDLFPLAVCAQFLLGIPSALGLASTPLVAVTWFPLREIGIAMAVHFSGYPIGLCFGFFIPSHLLPTVEDVGDMDVFLEATKMRSIYLFTVVSGFYFMLFAVTYVVVQDQPLIPPSNAELRKRERANHVKGEDCKVSNASKVSKCFKAIKSLVSSPSMCLISLSFALVFSNDTILFALLSDIVSVRGGDLLTDGTSEKLSGLAMTIYAISQFCTALIAGKLIARARNLKVYCCLFYLGEFLFTIVIASGVLLAKFIVLCCGLAAFGFGTLASFLSLIELACQNMFPTDELFVTSWLVMLGQTLAMTAPLILRQILEGCGYVPTICLQSALIGIGLVALLFARPKNRRKQADCDVVKKIDSDRT